MKYKAILRYKNWFLRLFNEPKTVIMVAEDMYWATQNISREYSKHSLVSIDFCYD